MVITPQHITSPHWSHEPCHPGPSPWAWQKYSWRPLQGERLQSSELQVFLLKRGAVEIIFMPQRVPTILLEPATFLTMEPAQPGERLGWSKQKRSGYTCSWEGQPKLFKAIERNLLSSGLPWEQGEVGVEGKEGSWSGTSGSSSLVNDWLSLISFGN